MNLLLFLILYFGQIGVLLRAGGGNRGNRGTERPWPSRWNRAKPSLRRWQYVAIYVATMSADLAVIAQRTGLETLSYLLEMVRLEAESVARHSGPQ